MSTIGITMGCPVGIGPEIILKHFHNRNTKLPYSTLVLGDIKVLTTCRDTLNIPVEIVPWKPGDTIANEAVSVYSLSSLPATELKWGKPNATTGKAMASYISSAISLLKEGTIAGITTCPISKYALHQAGLTYPGHTEMLADLTESTQFGMMMAGTQLRVVLVTIHCPLADVPKRLSKKSILHYIELTNQALSEDFALSSPSIGVAALNPHGGEQEMFGNEERLFIEPAIAAAQKKGIKVQGPFPPDTIFYKAAQGEYDTVLCMYHDQGLIPFKLLHFSDGVNVTLGLPIVRTSVDHGTAYDIAGQGIADDASLTAAVELAWTIVENRRKL